MQKNRVFKVNVIKRHDDVTMHDDIIDIRNVTTTNRSFLGCIYTVSQKNTQIFLDHNLGKCRPILIFFYWRICEEILYQAQQGNSTSP